MSCLFRNSAALTDRCGVKWSSLISRKKNIYIGCMQWSKTTVYVRYRYRHRNLSTSRHSRLRGVDLAVNRGSSRRLQGNVSPSVFWISLRSIFIGPRTRRLSGVAEVESTASLSTRRRRPTRRSARRPRQVRCQKTHCRRTLSPSPVTGELHLPRHQTPLNLLLSEMSISPITSWFALKVANLQNVIMP